MAKHDKQLDIVLALHGANAALIYNRKRWDATSIGELRGKTIRADGYLWEIHDPANPEPSYRVRPVDHEGRGVIWDADAEGDDLDDDDTGDDWKQ